MDYVQEVKKHLSDYKENVMMIQEKGIWKNNKEDYSYILPDERKNENLLSNYRQLLSEYLKIKKIKLHPGFHHLNSSQAMCLNFFFPLVKEEKLEYILDFLRLSSSPSTISEDEKILYSKVEFEKKSDDETSFDFYFETASGKKFYFEIKYTEGDFGKTKADSEHIKKFANVYKKLLDPLTKEYQNESAFLDNYQILRNLIHIDKNSYVVFVYPYGNKKIKDQAEAAKDKMLTAEFKDHIFPITWEVLFDKVTKNHLDAKLKNQYNELKKKYFLK